MGATQRHRAVLLAKGAEDHKSSILLLTPQPARPSLTDTDENTTLLEIQHRTNRSLHRLDFISSKAEAKAGR